jgi:hypothetical protein
MITRLHRSETIKERERERLIRMRVAIVFILTETLLQQMCDAPVYH